MGNRSHSKVIWYQFDSFGFRIFGHTKKKTIHFPYLSHRFSMFSSIYLALCVISRAIIPWCRCVGRSNEKRNCFISFLLIGFDRSEYEGRKESELKEKRQPKYRICSLCTIHALFCIFFFSYTTAKQQRQRKKITQ